MKHTMSGKNNKKVAIQAYNGPEQRRRFEPAVLDYGMGLIDPGNSRGLAPSYAPVRMAQIRDRQILDLNTQVDAGGNFYVEVNPSLVNTVKYTSGSSTSLDQAPWTVNAIFHPTNADPSIPMVDGAMVHTDHSRHVHASQFFSEIGFEIVGSANTSVWTLTATLESPHQMSAVIGVQGCVSGVWSSIATAVEFNWWVQNTMTINIPANMTALRFFMNPSGKDFSECRLRGSLVYASGTGTLGTGNDILTLQTVDTDLAKNVSDFVRYRIVYQDLLITYMGSDLANGGVLASARVSRGWRAEQADVYQEISLLPCDSYNGPLKEGTHVHWLPGAFSDLDPILAGESPNYQYKMVASGKLDDTSQSLRLYVNTVIEFYSYEPLYGAMNWCPPALDLDVMLRFVASAVPAATSNDRHLREKLGKALRAILGRGVNFVRDNPETVAKGILAALG